MTHSRTSAGPASTLVTGAGAAAAALGAAALCRRLPRSLRAHLERTNFHGDTVSLAEGVAAISALTATAPRYAGAGGTAALGLVGLVGLADDVLEPLLAISGTCPPKGLKGHLGALRRGQITTGNAKIAGIAFGALLLSRSAADCREHSSSLADLALDTVIIAGAANIVNLFDLRPGRALKATAVISLVGAAAARIEGACHGMAAVGGTLAALGRDDLKARTMLGDSGANVLGATAGYVGTMCESRAARVAAATVLVALTIASEKVSFSSVIASTPGLREFDEWGRDS